MKDLRVDYEAEASAFFHEHLRSIERGDRPDFDVLCARHAELAPALRRMRASFEAVDRLVPGPLEDSRHPGDAPPDPTDSGIDVEPAHVEAGSALLGRLWEQGPTRERYDALRVLGRGGMGVVRGMFDRLLHRRLALKESFVVSVDPRVSAQSAAAHRDVAAISRFLDEAQITSQLDHPGIVPVHEIGLSDGGQVYFTMRWVQGIDLLEALHRARRAADGWNRPRLLGVLIRVCETMCYAHSKRVIHRDLKPSNVMVGRFGEVYVVDWGLARIVEDRNGSEARLLEESAEADEVLRSERSAWRKEDEASPLLTKVGQAMGTPAYMSPEQARGEMNLVDERTDVFAVGAMLYHILEGKAPSPPAASEQPSETLPTLPQFGPSELIAICEKAMSTDPGARYASMQALADDLRAFVEKRVVRAYRTGVWARLQSWVRRNKAVAALLLLGLVSGLFIVATIPVVREARERAELSELEGRIEQLTRNSSRAGQGPPAGMAHDQWIVEAREMVKRIPDLERRLETRSRLSVNAAPRMEMESNGHRRASELQAKQQELLWHDRMLSSAPWPSPRSTAADTLRRADVLAWNHAIFNCVGTDHPRLVGREVEALQSAEALLLSTIGKSSYHPRFRDTLAFARFRCGQLDEAVLEQRRAVDEWRPEHGKDWEPSLRQNLNGLRLLRDFWRSELVQELKHRAFVDIRRIWWDVYLASRDSEEDDYRVSHLVKVLQRLWDIEEILRLVERGLRGLPGAPSWSEAIAAIRLNPRYGRLEITAQQGLAPLREDPVTGLWEFLHLPTGEVPSFDGFGYQMARHAGIVFILLPPGLVPREEDDSIRQFPDEMQPFFLSKYELTEAQWMRLGGPWRPEHVFENDQAPASGLSWEECKIAFERSGDCLMIPTTAEWEYACRAGSITKWSSGSSEESLKDCANISFVGAKSQSVHWVGSLKHNAYGFFDMHGNLTEWCCENDFANVIDPLLIPRYAGNGISLQPIRGGSFLSDSEAARSGIVLAAMQEGNGLENALVSDATFGVRPAMHLVR